MQEKPEKPRATIANFSETSWSVILQAQQPDEEAAHRALGQLCAEYWPPIYAYLRRRGHPQHQAQDLTQAFFAHLLTRDFLAQVEKDAGRFRTFLLACLANFLRNEWEKEHAWKRGGQHLIISWDADEAEKFMVQEPFVLATPEKAFDRRWALTLFERALDGVREDYAQAGNSRTFEVLQAYITGEVSPAGYAELAARLDRSENAVTVALHRLRRRFAEAVRGEVARTVARPEDVDEEIRHLFACIAE
jgi:RNA polymerase sigma factor (sigma-70 family)